MKFTPRRDLAAAVLFVTTATLAYWLQHGLAFIELVKATSWSVVGIFGGPLTAWLGALTYRGEPISLEGIFVLSGATGVLSLFWVPYFRERCRAAFDLALAVWLASGWFFTFGVRM